MQMSILTMEKSCSTLLHNYSFLECGLVKSRAETKKKHKC